MAALVTALDNFTPMQLGENGHVEYAWSNSFQERIVQFSFQLVRHKKDNDLSGLAKILFDMLSVLSIQVSKNDETKKEAKYYLSILYKMIGQTRDIIDGKGEYMLTYMMICVWNNFFPELASFALECLVKMGNEHQYGSWKDLKYFYDYSLSISDDPRYYFLNSGVVKPSFMVKDVIKLINDQLREDYTALMSTDKDKKISLLAKWVPREKSKYGSLFEILATDYFVDFITSAKDNESEKRAKLKCKTHYRKMLSALNKYLDTVQVKQCNGRWAEIDPSKQTSITMNKQKFAFLNKTKLGAQRTQEPDRIMCAERFNSYIKDAVEGRIEIKGKRVGMNDFTKSALDLLCNPDLHAAEIDLLNAQWRNNSSMTSSLGKMIAMVDVSGSMSGDPMHAAIALGIRIAEKSMLGKRVMTFSACPTWVNLESCETFTDMVSMVKKAEWGMNTNFYSALKMILDAIVKQKMSPTDVEDMVLVVLSDMQIDHASNEKSPLSETIVKLYHEAGMNVWGKPYKAPHILFWNLRATSGFPSLSTQKNVSMMSGFSPSILNLFCEEGMSSLYSCTPWSLMIKSLENERYTILQEKINSQIM